MHVLLIYPNKPRLSFGYVPAPYGLETLRAYLQGLPVECSIVNPFLSLDPAAAIRRALRPDTFLVGISIRNLDDALILWSPATASGEIQTESCIDDAKETIASCRAVAPWVPIVLGGAAFGHMPAELLDYLGIEIGFAGAAEADFAHLVRAMAVEDRSFDAAVAELGSAVSRARSLERGKGAKAVLRRDVPVLQREAAYFRFQPEAAVRTYSGCPLSCAHCIEHAATRRIAASPIDRVADEVEGVVARYPEVSRVFFADSEVNLAGEKRALALVDAVRARKTCDKISLKCYFNPHPMSLRTLDGLARARCEVSLTVDHVADEVLARNGKNFRNRHLRALVEQHAALGIELSFSLLLGQPGESKATLDNVLRFVDWIPQSIRGPIYFSPGVRVYPGTPMARDLVAGRLDASWLVDGRPEAWSFVEPVVYCEGYRPRELFEYISERSGGRMMPMNGFLAEFAGDSKAIMDEEFRRYHVGLASLAEDDDASLRAWSAVRDDAPFLSFSKRVSLLWSRGNLALKKGQPEQALADWRRLRAILGKRDGAVSEKLDHNLRVAEAITASGVGAPIAAGLMPAFKF